MEKMLDAGFCLPAIGFAFRRVGRGYWIFKGNYPYFIRHQASSIQYLAYSDINVCFSCWFKVPGSRFKVKNKY